jgi:hypothetical protein
MRLDPLYTVTFTTPEACRGRLGRRHRRTQFPAGRGRSTGRLSARYRASNFPRKRADGALVPEFLGVLETDDGGVILFEWQGLAVLTQLRHAAAARKPRAHYRRPLPPLADDRVCTVEGEVRPATDTSGSEVVFQVSEMVWEGVQSARRVSP